MVLPKPALLPEWATGDKQDPVSGQFNVVEPPPEKKISGYLLGEKPNRQYLNWLFRTTNDWIAYFDSNLDFDSDTIVPVWTGLTNQPVINYFYYSKEGDRCYFSCHITWAGNVNPNPLVMTNLPFAGKNSAGFIQSVHVSRGAGPTNADGAYANGKIISALIYANQTTLNLWGEKPADGLGSELVASAIGQLIISGFYFIEQ